MSKSWANEAFYFLRAGIRMIGSRLRRASSANADSSSENGQILILTAMAGVAMVGFLALAVDVGNMYFERRAAQNAADTAALVGAQDTLGVLPNLTIDRINGVKDARVYAIKNGFNTDSGANNDMCSQEVCVYTPPISPPSASDHTGPDYIEVDITRTVNTFFAGVLGIKNMTVTAHAVARDRQYGIDAATISLDPGDDSTAAKGGNAWIDGNSYSAGNTDNKTASATLYISGTAYATGTFVGNVSATEGEVSSASPLHDPGWGWCGTANASPGLSWYSGVITNTDANGYKEINPGTYTYIDVASGDKVQFNPGIYHLTWPGSTPAGVNINGTAVSSGPVCFELDNGATFQVQGTAKLDLYSGSLYNYILIWSADTGTNSVKIAGGASLADNANPGDLPLNGTIYAPHGTVRLAGSSAGDIRGQVVARDIYLEGGSGTSVKYDPRFAAALPNPVLVE